MSEGVRLVIWDLDETFWHGTLTEGGYRLREDTRNIVKELAKRGIISTICSKNNFSDVKNILLDFGVWNYFVMPSIDWTPKGPRIANIIEQFQLRAATVMFIDDNPVNLNEARYFVKDIQIESHKFIPCMLSSELFKGKNDEDLTRLQQYKQLEERQIAKKHAGTDLIPFLRNAKIKVYIESDISLHIDRAIELINRTNQLNFTKIRIPESKDKAIQYLQSLISSVFIQAGLVSVSDRYGDHGFCGIFVKDISTNRLLHFAFSCRILGLQVENWLYARLGRPELVVAGEVLSDVISGHQDIDWVTEYFEKDTNDVVHEKALVSRIVARGGCDLLAVTHYLNVISDDINGEFNTNRAGHDARIDHTNFLLLAFSKNRDSIYQATAPLGLRPDDFTTALSPQQTENEIWILSLWSDPVLPLYQHKKLHFSVPYDLPGCRHLDLTKSSLQDLPPQYRTEDVNRALKCLSENYAKTDRISENSFKNNLRLIADMVQQYTLLIVSEIPEFSLDQGFPIKNERAILFNKWTREVFASIKSAAFLNMFEFVTSEQEVITPYHFDRMVYYRMSQRIIGLAREHFAPPQDRDASKSDARNMYLQNMGNPVAKMGAAVNALSHSPNLSEKYAMEALIIDPSSISCKRILLLALIYQGKIADANDLIATLIVKSFPDSLLLELGKACMSVSEYVLAELFLSQAVISSTLNFGARHALANTLDKQGRYDEALQIFTDGIALGDDNPHVFLHAMKLSCRVGKDEDARNLGRLAASMHPEFSPIQEFMSTRLSV